MLLVVIEGRLELVLLLVFLIIGWLCVCWCGWVILFICVIDYVFIW